MNPWAKKARKIGKYMKQKSNKTDRERDKVLKPTKHSKGATVH